MNDTIRSLLATVPVSREQGGRRLRGVTHEGKAVEFDLDNPSIETVYSGRPGCACGCRGKHTENTPEHARSVANVLRRIAEAPEGERVVSLADKVAGAHVAVESSTRLYIAYLAPSADVKLVT